MSRFRRPGLIILVLALMLLQVVPTYAIDEAGSTLARRIAAVVGRADYRLSQWGILVVDSKTGEVVFALNADQLLMPASVTKLYSVAAALGLLGADYCFATPVHRRGTVSDGILQGDLILVAQGDLTLGGRTDANGKLAFRNVDHTYANFFTDAELTDTDPLAGLKDLARQVAASGIREVAGEVLIDERLFERSVSTGSGPRIVSPIVVNDNVIDLIVIPGAGPGDPAKVEMRPDTPYLRLDAVVTTGAKDAKPRLNMHSGAGETVSLRGVIPVESRPLVACHAVEDPGTFARALFIDCLRQAGVRVQANPWQPPRAELPERDRYEASTRVALFRSPPLREVLHVTLKVSHNLYASTLPLLIAAKHGKRTLAEGLHLQQQFLKDLGVDTEMASFGGGAGGDPADRATARATVQLLRALARRPDYALFEEALPVLGIDGTLAGVVDRSSPARGAVRAKTGTYVVLDVFNNRPLLTSKALAGTMTTRSGRRLTFAFFVNNVPLPADVTSSREGRTLGHLCEILYEDASG